MFIFLGHGGYWGHIYVSESLRGYFSNFLEWSSAIVHTNLQKYLAVLRPSGLLIGSALSVGILNLAGRVRMSASAWFVLFASSIKISQKSPPPLLLPSLLLPFISRLRIKVNHVEKSLIVRNHRKDIVLRIKLIQFFDALACQLSIVMDGTQWFHERLCRAFVWMDCLEKCSWADKIGPRVRSNQRIWLDLLRQWEILSRSELPAVVSNVAAHHNELWWIC